MAERPKGYGMTAELQAKKESKYDPQLENQARKWIEAVTGETIAPGKTGFQESLKDGKILCKLMNTIQPGSVKKINESKMAFKMMENIGKYLEATEAYGVPKLDSFQTVDLYEDQNMPQVINAIIALGRKAQKKGFNKGPALGPKESTANPREFSEDQLKEGQQVIGLQMGSNKGASQAGATPYGLGRQIEKTNLKV